MKKVHAHILCIALALSSAGPVQADTVLNQGIAFYKAGQYSRARDYFISAVKKSPMEWQAHYELANTFMRMNELPQAREQYTECLKLSPEESVAKLCGQMIAYIDHASGAKPFGPTTPATPAKQPPADASQAGHIPFRHRINVVPPQFDHPAVSESTILTVSHVLDTLPPNIYEILDNGGATVNVSPNITDKWPDMLKGKLDAEGLHLAQDAARCYDKDVYIYERKIIPNTTRLGDEVFDSASVTNVLYHELGHAVDCCSGTFTNTKEFLDVYQRDVDEMSEEMRHRLWYYTKPGYTGGREAFAETFAGIMGANGKDTNEVRSSFPRLKRWVLDRFRL